uniref:Reverse transcriptase Ty1/copia-type domain-containing protein n=1 Tax=Cannabis sativa TaxID=3483 RepID=A0A803QBG4_CANSA
MPSSAIGDISPFECLLHKAPDYEFLKTFGCACFPYLQPYNAHKLNFKSDKCIFIVYSLNHKGYLCENNDGMVYITRNVEFNEVDFPGSLIKSTSQVPSNSYLPIPTTTFSTPIMHTNANTPLAEVPNLPTHVAVDNAAATTLATNSVAAHDIPEVPAVSSLTEAATIPPMHIATTSQPSTGTISTPSTSNKWVHRIKLKVDGSLDKYKSMLVAKGYSQTPETVYMPKPLGFIDPKYPNYVCKLNKAFYGLKQAPRTWNHKLKNTLYNKGFQLSKFDNSLFIKGSGQNLIVLLVYVDDILITRPNQVVIDAIITALNHEFDVKDLGSLHYLLGVEVHRTTSGIYLSQSKYIVDFLTKLKMDGTKPCPSPTTASHVLSLTNGEPFADHTLYKSTLGALQYLKLTRPDVAFIVNKLSQFIHAPTTVHWDACKRLF